MILTQVCSKPAQIVNIEDEFYCGDWAFMLPCICLWGQRGRWVLFTLSFFWGFMLPCVLLWWQQGSCVLCNFYLYASFCIINWTDVWKWGLLWWLSFYASLYMLMSTEGKVSIIHFRICFLPYVLLLLLLPWEV